VAIYDCTSLGGTVELFYYEIQIYRIPAVLKAATFILMM